MFKPGLSLPKLPATPQMQSWDKACVDFGLPDTMLMENASRSALRLLSYLKGPLHNKKILVLMGGGNNGGDAVCMARLLHDLGADTWVAHAKNLTDLKGACRFHAGLAAKDGIKFFKLNPSSFPECAEYLRRISFTPDIILDGLIGAALQGELSEGMKNLIQSINYFAAASKAFVLALDVPSGLSANTGAPMPCAIKAHATAAMAFAKKGLVLTKAREYTGKVYVCDIGMPIALDSERMPDLHLIDGRLVLSQPALPGNSYKNLFGHVTVIGGQGGLSGAARLASLAALRAGAGLVTACSPPGSISQIKSGFPELMTLAAGNGDAWPKDIPDDLASLIKSSQALVIGPGMGRDGSAAAFLRSLLAMPDRPRAVIDADALFHLANYPDWLGMLTENDVITPHPGEAARLLNISADGLNEDRLGSLARLMGMTKAAVILKGADTLAGRGGLPALLCPYDVPQMAIAGAGDVLSGCLGAMLARRDLNEDSLLSCARAVTLHVGAGLLCAQKYPGRGALASDLAECLAHAREFLQSQDQSALLEGQVPWP